MHRKMIHRGFYVMVLGVLASLELFVSKISIEKSKTIANVLEFFFLFNCSCNFIRILELLRCDYNKFQQRIIRNHTNISWYIGDGCWGTNVLHVCWFCSKICTTGRKSSILEPGSVLLRVSRNVIFDS